MAGTSPPGVALQDYSSFRGFPVWGIQVHPWYVGLVVMAIITFNMPNYTEVSQQLRDASTTDEVMWIIRSYICRHVHLRRHTAWRRRCLKELLHLTTVCTIRPILVEKHLLLLIEGYNERTRQAAANRKQWR